MKYYAYILAIIVVLFITAWLFNHVHAWAGVVFFLTAVGVSIKTIKNKIDKP
jgi:Ca2+/Na+ antiporter